VKAWIGISLGIHVTVFGVCGTRPAPTRNLVLPANVYSVNLVSMPAARAPPPPRAAETREPAKAVEVKPTPRPEAMIVDEEAVKPVSAKTRKRETPKEPVEKEKPEELEERKETEEPDVAQEEPPAGSSAAESDGAPEGPVAVSALGQTSTQASVSLDAANFGFSYYLVGLQAKVASNWFPPGSLGAPGEVLRTTVHFRVMDDGTIVNARIENSSGVSYFDRCALRAILLSSPLAPLPAAFEEDELGVHFEFSHTVNIQ